MRLLRLATLLALAAPPVLAATPNTSTVPIMPLSEVRPGMQATVRTVFEAGRVEEFGAEIVAVMDSYLGPHQDLILARLHGERVAFTGVAAGMSGSPVYIDGKLVGALSYRMGQFLKEPIAGITPIEYMLGVAQDHPDDQSLSGAAGAGSAAAFSAVPAPDGLQPIETSLMLAGAPPQAIALFSGELARLGLTGIVPGGAAVASPSSNAAATPSTGTPGSSAAPRPRAGDPIAAQLITGDISFAATGTITHVDGDHVYAFGHPAFFNGAADVPMARAEIYLTLASLQASNKMSRVLDTIGTFHQSRLPAMTGLLGPGPRMVPVTVRVATAAGSRSKSYSYQVVDHTVFTPPLVGLLAAASLVNTPSYSDVMTLSLSGRIAMKGHPDVVLKDLYSDVPGGQSPVAVLSQDVQGIFAAVFQNRWEHPTVTSVDLDISAVEKNELSVVEAVYPTRTEVNAGEPVEIRVLIRPYRGTAFTRKLSYQVPEGTPPGMLAVYVGGANLLGTVERNVLARQLSQADQLDQIVRLVNRLRTSDRLYMKVARRQSGAIVLDEIMPALPPSVQSTLNGNRGTGEVTPLAETTIHEESIPLDQMVVGGSVVMITVK